MAPGRRYAPDDPRRHPERSEGSRASSLRKVDGASHVISSAVLLSIVDSDFVVMVCPTIAIEIPGLLILSPSQGHLPFSATVPAIKTSSTNTDSGSRYARL